MAISDDEAMARALELAERGRGSTSPNPVVGCVIVAGDAVVGEGWHERAGGPHAEVVALRAAGARAAGATAYVTLEPCGHRGRTGPCTAALAEAGVARVVYAAADPRHGGASALRAAGVAVEGGIAEVEARAQNEVFFHVAETGRPFVTLKLAQSLDGRVAARDGSSRWITSSAAREEVHRRRAAADAVVVGSGTVLDDDPELDVRHVAADRQPRPVVLDARGRTPLDARVLRRGAIVLTSAASDPGWREAVEARGADVGVVGAGEGAGLDLAAALGWLLDRDVTAVLVEGGPTVAGAFLRAGLVDRLVLHVAPLVIGGDGRPAFGAPGAGTLAAAWRWRIESLRQLGPDLEVVARQEA